MCKSVELSSRVIGEVPRDVMTSSSTRMGPCILVSCPPKSGETHVIREGVAGPVICSHLFCIYHSPSIRPVWWILSSALLSWVIWGIIPKVSHPNSSVHFLRARLFSSHSLHRTAAPIANVSFEIKCIIY